MSSAGARRHPPLLIDGLGHVAVLTADVDRFVAFYAAVFDARVLHDQLDGDGFRFCVLEVGARAELNVFQIAGNTQCQTQQPMFGRGRLDHLAVRAADVAAFIELRRRLRDAGASDGFVTDFGPVLSVCFRDPDGLESEVVVDNPDARPGVLNPPGTPWVAGPELAAGSTGPELAAGSTGAGAMAPVAPGGEAMDGVSGARRPG